MIKLIIKNKKLVAIGIVVIVGISVILGVSLNNKEKFVVHLEKMMYEKNISGLQKSIVVGTKERKATKDEIVSLYSYLKSDEKK